MKKIRSLIACVASLCIVSTCAFSVSAAEDNNQTINGPATTMSNMEDLSNSVINVTVATQPAYQAVATESDAQFTGTAVTTEAVTTSAAPAESSVDITT